MTFVPVSTTIQLHPQITLTPPHPTRRHRLHAILRWSALLLLYRKGTFRPFSFLSSMPFAQTLHNHNSALAVLQSHCRLLELGSSDQAGCARHDTRAFFEVLSEARI
jgi:uncharacterized protein VirK/YbjX